MNSGLNRTDFHQFYNVVTAILNQYDCIVVKHIAEEIVRLPRKKNKDVFCFKTLISQIFKIIEQRNSQKEEFTRVFRSLRRILCLKLISGPSLKSFGNCRLNCIEVIRPNYPISFGEDPVVEMSVSKTVPGLMCICRTSIVRLRMKHSCHKCNGQFHNVCYQWTTGEFACPECILDFYDPFYKKLKQIIPLQLIKNTEVFSFELFLDDFDTCKFIVLKSLRIIREKGENYNYCDVNFPQNVQISINDKIILCLEPDVPGFPRRKDFPVIIPIRRKNLFWEGANFLLIKWTNEVEEFVSAKYLFSVAKSMRLTSSILIEKILRVENSSLETRLSNGIAFLSQSFKAMDSHEFRISPICQITLQAVKLPVRGNLCTHLNVFCLMSFLSNLENSETRRPRCPICLKPIFVFKVDFFMLLFKKND